MASSKPPLIERLPSFIKMQPFELSLAVAVVISGTVTALSGGLLAMSIPLSGGWLPLLMRLWDVIYVASALLILVALVRPSQPGARAMERGGLILLSTCAFIYAITVIVYSSGINTSVHIALMHLGIGGACLVRSALLAEVDRIVLDTLKEANSRRKGDTENGSK